MLALILANVRTPDEREGDLTAQIAANRVAEARLREIVARYGRRRIERYAAALQDYTERVLRATIAAIPDGDYRFEDALDDDGFSESPIWIRVAHHASTAIAPTIDFTGSDRQTQRQRQRELRDHAVGDALRASAVWCATTCCTTPASRGRCR